MCDDNEVKNMNIEEAITSRYSARLLKKDQPIAKADLKKIVKLAQSAPSWVDSQPWKVYIATGKTLDKVKRQHIMNVENGVKSTPDWETMHRDQWADFPRENMRVHNEDTAKFWEDPRLADITRLELETNLFDAAAICYLTIPKDSNMWSAYDLGGFGQTLMLAAKGMGIDSIPAYEIVRFPNSVREIMEIPEQEWVAMGIALGYTDAVTKANDYRAHRVPEDEILTIKD